MPSPFPGMDPYLERQRRDVHTRLVAYASDALNEVLPPDLVSRMEERVYVETDEGATRIVSPDVRVIERPSHPPRGPSPGGAAAGVAEPVYLQLEAEPVTERFIQITEVDGGRVITAIEFLSPANKLPGEGRDAYMKKRKEFLASDANLVEIDLVRAGRWTTMLKPYSIPTKYRTTYRVSVRRAAMPDRLELYPVTLRQSLPKIAIPLRPTDTDVALALQPLIDRVSKSGRYDTLDYGRPSDPPLAAEDLSWFAQLRSPQSPS